MFQGEDFKADEHQDSNEAEEAKKKIFPFLHGHPEPEGTKSNGAWVEQLCSTVEWFVEIEDEYLEAQLKKIKENKDELRLYFEKLFAEVTSPRVAREALLKVEKLKQAVSMKQEDINMFQRAKDVINEVLKDLEALKNGLEGKTMNIEKAGAELETMKERHSRTIFKDLEQARSDRIAFVQELKRTIESMKQEQDTVKGVENALKKIRKELELILTNEKGPTLDNRFEALIQHTPTQPCKREPGEKERCLSCLKEDLARVFESMNESFAPVRKTEKQEDMLEDYKQIILKFEELTTQMRRMVKEEMSSVDEEKVIATIENIEVIFNPRKILQRTQDSEQTPESQQYKALRELIEKATKEFGRSEKDVEHILEYLAECLYGLIHAKYITTRPGLMKMAVLFQNFTFGKCPRFGCGGCPVLPIGMSDDPVPDDPRLRQVCVFCPLCHDIYRVQEIDDRDGVFMNEVRDLNGAFFGTSFPGLFMVTFPPFSAEVVKDDDGIPIEGKDFKRPGVRLL